MVRADGTPVGHSEPSGGGLEAAAEADALYRIRHSLAHVMAQAVLVMRPGSTLGFGPPIRDGFYYDFILSSPLTEEDFPELEQKMRKILKKGQRFYREDLDRSAALAQLEEMGEPYKQEYARELLERQQLDGLSFYRNGDFLDMCEGPHVDTTKEIPRDAFRLRSVAGAYWRGNSDNVMMTRIYAWAFTSRAELESQLEAWELAQQRDHKRLGRELDIYHIDNDVGRGLPLWLPNGTVIRDELEQLAREFEFRYGYQRVSTPPLARVELYEASGHLPYYADGMYPFMDTVDESAGDGAEVVRERYVLRPMNCPHHHKVFDARPRSYRELPLRLAEYGQVFRWEDSGAVGGLVRVRGMCMNDAHIYCTPDQVQDEFRSVIEMYREIYSLFGFTDYTLRLSRWDPEDPKGKYVDDPQAWAATEKILTTVLDEMAVDYVDGPGEAAFYGPKIDFQFRTVTGREETVSTIQLDFAQPGRLGLTYHGSDGQAHTPYCIHRAPLSTHERFVAFLIEHFGGAFPVWLAPVQVQLVTVSDQFDEYAEGIIKRLRQHFVRAELAPHGETVPKKIRAGATRKIPVLLIVGEREQAEGTVTVRRYGVEQQVTLTIAAFETALRDHIAARELRFDIG